MTIDPIDQLERLKCAVSLRDVAEILGFDPNLFFHVVKHADDGSYYRVFNIPKKSGGLRLISCPTRGLGLAQSRLAKVLKSKYKPKSSVKGYIKGESFISNAMYHEGQKWILNLDIKDFYPGIKFPRVRGLFMSKYFGFNPIVATILARITTTSNGLPQGARTSPIIANMIAANLDKKLISIATSNRLKYTRYADDITFSSSQRTVPSILVQSWEPKFGKRDVKLGQEVINSFNNCGFNINENKTRIMMNYERQEVTGLIVNKVHNVWRKDIEKLRMMLYSARKYGSDGAARLWIAPDKTGTDFWNYICGWLAYISQVRGKNDLVLAKMCKLAISSGLRGPAWVIRRAEMVREFDVFLSHASEDKPKIRRLKERLESLGIKVFFDEDSIKWGDSIPEKINQGLLKSNFFIPFLTINFERKGWTNKELNAAFGLNFNRKSRILPIKDESFSIGEHYPLINDILYKEWPHENDVDFINQISDEILKIIESEKTKKHDLG